MQQAQGPPGNNPPNLGEQDEVSGDELCGMVVADEYQLEPLAEEALDLLVAAGDEACRWADVETAALVHYRKAVQAARWRLWMSEEDERYLKLSLRLGHTLAAAGHRRAAEVVYREVARRGRTAPGPTRAGPQCPQRAAAQRVIMYRRCSARARR